jgi:hypothetical protein
MPLDSAAWMETFVALQRDVQQHVDREENDLIERCKDVISRERLRAMDRNYNARRELPEESLERETPERTGPQPEYRPPA